MGAWGQAETDGEASASGSPKAENLTPDPVKTMGALTFDTLSASRVLVEGGLNEKQAEAVTRVIKEAQDTHLEELATKADLKSEIAEAKGEIIKWVAVMLVAQAGAIAALVKLL